MLAVQNGSLRWLWLADGGKLEGPGATAEELGEDDGSLDWLLKHSLVMRRKAGWAHNRDMQLRPMLKLGCLAMQPVHVCTRSSGTPLLDGAPMFANT